MLGRDLLTRESAATGSVATFSQEEVLAWPPRPFQDGADPQKLCPSNPLQPADRRTAPFRSGDRITARGGTVTEVNLPMCMDAVILLPGIMGSELVATDTGVTLWGLSSRSYATFWTSGSHWEDLKVTEDELAGRTGRVEARRLLKFPAFAPVLRGFEPYSKLSASLREIVNHDDAILEFPYDWRLSVAHNARHLATAAERHLAQWRSHRFGSRDARLVLVAHSMGGLLARFFTGVLGGGRDVRLTIAVGTPFQGSANAILTMNRGSGAPLPLPRKRLLELAVSLPSIYELLPSYRCVVQQDGLTRTLTAEDVSSLGGSSDLADAALRVHRILDKVSVDNLRTMIGIEQPTVQSVRIRDGVAEPLNYIVEDREVVDWSGDGTVYTQVASGGLEPIFAITQTHGALTRTPEVISALRFVLTKRRLGPPMGSGGVSISAPEVVVVN
jgi:pimeloyl-ACP methyl ester carboxylesterase